MATGGVVLRSHVTNLRMARIESPSYEKLVALAKAMGFALWRSGSRSTREPACVLIWSKDPSTPLSELNVGASPIHEHTRCTL